ncbi:DMT family transporter [Jiangella alkaliphila]|uniref:EamA domain-containing membrane protein RarD n=1 Tax=Jiangella alkaliphila TaxID=419479 RepID=A0A1H2GQ33_9ACTN|nr:DMT family transporter [Jiangella alkaliphila]SDU21707.1 EamA domain-containing membrane protein RarD [Jiangella alkaliphila]
MTRFTSPAVAGALACTVGMTVVGASIAFGPLLADYPVLAGQAWRYLVAGLVLLAVMRARRVRLPRLRPRQLGRLVLLAGTGLAAFNWLLIEGTTRSDPAFMAAVLGATPLVLALAGPLLDGGRVRAWTLAGSTFVVAGILVVQGATTAPLGALPYAVGFLLCEAAFTLLAVPLLREFSPLQVSGAVCLVAVPLLAVLAVLEPGADLVVPTASEAATLAFLAVCTTAIAFLLWYGGVVRLGADRAGLFAGVMPIAGLIVGVVAGTSAWTPVGLAGSLLCGAGIALGLRRPTASARRRRAEPAADAVPETV